MQQTNRQMSEVAEWKKLLETVRDPEKVCGTCWNSEKMLN